jgi:hypothetical protein
MATYVGKPLKRFEDPRLLTGWGSFVGPCTCTLRLNTTSSLVDRHRGTKAWTRGLSCHPSGPLTPVDALEAGRADARRLLGPPHLAAPHEHCLLTPPLAAATAARERAGLLANSRHGPSTPPPSWACTAATAWPTLCHGWAGAAAAAGARRREGGRNCNTHGTRRAAAARRPRPCRVY